MNKKINVFKIMTIISMVTSLLFLVLLLILNVLPFKYFIPVFLFLLVVNGVLFILAFVKKVKNKQAKFILSIIAGILSALMLILSFYFYRTLSFIGSFGNSNYKTENYSVVVLKSSGIEDLKGLTNKNVGYFDSNHEGLSLALTEIKDKLTAQYEESSSVDSLYNSLIENEIDGMLIEDSYIDMLKEIDSDFEQITKIIYTFSVKIKVEDISKNVDVTEEPFAVYISGIDTYGEINSVSRSDVNIVAVVNPKTYQVLLISIPRDYYVQLHGTTGYKDKLTHAGMYGIEMSVQTIEDLLDIDINYYFKVNFTSLIDIVDALGGIEVYSEYSFDSEVGYYFYKGYNKMDGNQTLAFARTRHAFIDGDRQRGKNQQAVIEAIIRKVASKAIITKYDSLLNAVSGKFQTNLETSDITSLAKLQLDKMPSWTIKSISLNGTDSSNYTYTYNSGKLYVMEPDQNSINEAKTNIAQLLGDQKLESSYGEVSNVKNPGIVDTTPEVPSVDHSQEVPNTESILSLSSNDITVKVGETTKLVAKTTSEDKISWKSSNPDVATVSDNGVITPISNGVTTITVSISGTTVNCIVRVIDPLDSVLPDDEIVNSEDESNNDEVLNNNQNQETNNSTEDESNNNKNNTIEDSLNEENE